MLDRLLNKIYRRHTKLIDWLYFHRPWALLTKAFHGKALDITNNYYDFERMKFRYLTDPRKSDKYWIKQLRKALFFEYARLWICKVFRMHCKKEAQLSIKFLKGKIKWLKNPETFKINSYGK